jgi:hypothetical protein
LEHGSWVVGAQFGPRTQLGLLVISSSGALIGEFRCSDVRRRELANQHRLVDAQELGVPDWAGPERFNALSQFPVCLRVGLFVVGRLVRPG